jgi:heme-degrading monooxygenase HmoA
MRCHAEGPWELLLAMGRIGRQGVGVGASSIAMVIVLIRTQVREDADRAEYERLGVRMDELVRTVSGFVSAKDYAAEDGESVSMVIFESHDALAAWRNLPEHVEAQRAGKERIYAAYDIRVCEVVRAYDFTYVP